VFPSTSIGIICVVRVTTDNNYTIDDYLKNHLVMPLYDFISDSPSSKTDTEELKFYTQSFKKIYKRCYI